MPRRFAASSCQPPGFFLPPADGVLVAAGAAAAGFLAAGRAAASPAGRAGLCSVPLASAAFAGSAGFGAGSRALTRGSRALRLLPLHGAWRSVPARHALSRPPDALRLRLSSRLRVAQRVLLLRV